MSTYVLKQKRNRDSLPPLRMENAELIWQHDASMALIRIGMPAHLKGYCYLQTAVAMLLKHPEMKRSMTAVVYPEVALLYGVSSSQVERCIRHAIGVTWDRVGPEVFCRVIGCALPVRPTNGELIALLAERIRIYRML